MDFSQLFKLLDEQKEYFDKVLACYHDKRVPIGTIAKIVGRDLLTTWNAFLEHTQIEIKTACGGARALEEAVKIFSQQNVKIVLDPFSIDLIFKINIENEIYKYSGVLGITQSTLELLLQQIEKVKQNQGNHGTLRAAGSGKYEFTENTTEQAVETVQELTRIKDWLLEHCEVLKSTPTYDAASNNNEKLTRIFDQSLVDTMQAATHDGWILLSDDEVYREFCCGVYPEINSGWMQPLMIAMCHMRALSDRKYVNAIVRLIRYKMNWIMISSRDLLELINRKDGYDLFCIGASIFSRDNIDLNSARMVILDVVNYLWIKRHPERDKYTLILLENYIKSGCGLPEELIADFLSLNYSFTRIERMRFATLIFDWCKLNFFSISKIVGD